MKDVTDKASASEQEGRVGARTPPRWDVEDEGFWQSTGRKIANRNLWISIPNLLCGFSVWLYWGMVAKYVQKAHFADASLFNFLDGDGQPMGGDAYRALLFGLPATAGLMGATLRIPNSFMIAICGGRNVKFMTTLMLMLPAIGAGFALQQPDTPFLTFVILAALSGVGGGAFASSMSNISFFFPKRMQGLALGLNAGLGNAGVSVMQFLIPFIITFGAFGGLGGEPYQVGESQLWIQNAALVWVPILALFLVFAFFGMNNLPQHKCGSTLGAVGKYLWLTVLGFIAGGLAVYLLFLDWGSFPKLAKIFVILVVAVIITVQLMKRATPSGIKENLDKQFEIFHNKHNWVMTWLYVMTFGSFIGYANAFPKLIDDVFGFIRVGADGSVLPEAILNPNAPITANFIWIGAGVGALIRPVGGWLSDKIGGARVTHWDTIVMIGATIGAGYYVSLAAQSPTPEQYFMPFLLIFILLFATTGIGNGSTFRMIPIIFSKEQAGPVLGWTSAIAAYGAFLIPKIFGEQIKAGTPEYALYGFAGYYASCLVVNWWFYARKNAEIPLLMLPSINTRIFLVVAAGFGLSAIAVTADWRPLNTHKGYAPEQPMPYSHRLHAGELGIDCLFCHYGARTSRHAGIPPTSVCMSCHATVSAGFDALLEERARAEAANTEPERLVSEPIAQLYAAMGLDADLQPLEGGPVPIEWVRVHNLPDFVAFDHSVHVARGLACETCHGPVQAMERVRQESDLSMGWCVSCHRERAADPKLTLTAEHGRLPAGEHVSTDCAACHY